MSITYTLIVLFAFFLLAIGFKQILFPKLCAICASVSSVWFLLILLRFLGYNTDPVFIALLLGGSIVGGMYYIDKKLGEYYRLFKFPIMITGFLVAYHIAVLRVVELSTLFALTFIWLAFVFVGIFQSKLGFVRIISKKIIKCCRNW